MKLGVIGAGNIIEFHIKAAIAVGFEPTLIGAKPGSQNALNIKNKYHFKTLANSIDDFLDATNELDALLIAASWNNLYELLEKTFKMNIPILIEKPVFSNVSQISTYSKINHNSKVLVGYNRRYYSSVQEMKRSVESNPDTYFEIFIPELSGNSDISQHDIFLTLTANSVHMIDLALYMFGNLQITKIDKFEISGSIISVNITVESPKHRGLIKIGFGIPGNYSMTCFAKNQLLELKPLENFKQFSGMDIVPPSETYPLRSYTPRIIRENLSFIPGNIEDSFKPGFIEQYQEFKDLVNGKEIKIGCDLKHAAKVSEFAFDIIRFINNV